MGVIRCGRRIWSGGTELEVMRRTERSRISRYLYVPNDVLSVQEHSIMLHHSCPAGLFDFGRCEESLDILHQETWCVHKCPIPVYGNYLSMGAFQSLISIPKRPKERRCIAHCQNSQLETEILQASREQVNFCPIPSVQQPRLLLSPLATI